MLRVFLVFLSLRLSVALPAALTCPSLCSLIAWCAPWSTRGDRRSISVADKGLAPRSMCPLTGLACILLTRMSTSERRVGEGRFFFVSPPCLLFPLFYFAWRCAQPLGATAQEGCWRCVNPFRAMPLHYRNKGCYPLENPVFTPPSAASLRRNGGLGRGGSFSFSLLVFFSPYSILLGVVHSHCVQLHKRGIGTLCAEFRRRIGPSTKPRTMPARATSGMSVRRQKTRGQLHGNGELFAPPSSFVFERRARRVSSHRAAVVRGRRWKDTAAKETNAGQKRNL